jgi:SAM-dependent methyltransferase
MERAVRDLLKLLNEYEPTTLSIRREETRDLFKKLYHYLLPREVRHNLGEYYTPDWLAQRLLNQIDNEYFTADPRRKAAILGQKLKELRFLDPACGSGTFLVLIIARMLQLGDSLMMTPKELLDAILRNVVGIDLNPLAVLTARVNYVLAISDLLGAGGEITIPIYLADSVRTPAEGEGLFGKDVFEFPTAIGKFYVPSVVCKPERFDRFCGILEESVKSEVAPESFTSRVVSALKLTKDDWNDAAQTRLKELYAKLLDYHKRGMNGLWARLLRNNFAPLTIGQFDYIVGNPPWVNWESLPDDYRDSIKPLWVRYGLFPHGGMDTILGKGKKDISMLMTYAVCDTLLKTYGRLGFVVTQTLFKTSGAGQGFRRFRIPNGSRGQGIPLRVICVDDMSELSPFEGATNRTAVMVLEKGKPTRYPVHYTLWRKQPAARFTYDSPFGDVIGATRRSDLSATHVDSEDPTSSWLCAKHKALRALLKVLGKSEYVAREGSNTGGANAVYWVSVVKKRPDGLLVVRNITENAKVKVDDVMKPVEPQLLYPLLRGRDVTRWRASTSASIVMAQDRRKRRGIDLMEMQNRFPKTLAYLKLFEKTLKNRPSRGISDMIRGGAPFYTMFGVSDYTFASWKVVWREVAEKLDAAVAGPTREKVTIPDHTLIMVECTSGSEAHYLAAALNSTPCRHAVQSYIVLHPDPHILEHVRIPKFDPKNKVHQRLSELSAKAHDLVRNQEPETKNQELASVESEIDRQAAQIWGLTDAELAEIQRSLKELTE